MEHTAQVMGIAGAGRGTGVTHFVIQAANYLCSCRQKNSYPTVESTERSGKNKGIFRCWRKRRQPFF